MCPIPRWLSAAAKKMRKCVIALRRIELGNALQDAGMGGRGDAEMFLAQIPRVPASPRLRVLNGPPEKCPKNVDATE